MNQELQEKLFQKYPKIFRQRNLDKTKTAMCYGIQCPDHWYDLIDILCSQIEKYTERKEIVCEAMQVKEKFGGLRFYAAETDDYIDGLIAMSESLSYKIKE